MFIIIRRNKNRLAACGISPGDFRSTLEKIVQKAVDKKEAAASFGRWITLGSMPNRQKSEGPPRDCFGLGDAGAEVLEHIKDLMNQEYAANIRGNHTKADRQDSNSAPPQPRMGPLPTQAPWGAAHANPRAGGIRRGSSCRALPPEARFERTSRLYAQEGGGKEVGLLGAANGSGLERSRAPLDDELLTVLVRPIKSNIVEEQIALGRPQGVAEEAAGVPEADVADLLGKPAHVGVGRLPAREAAGARVEVARLDRGEDLLDGAGVVGVRAYMGV